MLRRSKSDATNDNGSVSHPTRILVVDDDIDACELIARIIESAGWQAERAGSHIDAMGTLLGKTEFTAVVVDFSAGGGTGSSLKLLDAVRSEETCSDLPVILLTRTTQNRNFAWESGADAFLVRPFHADDLVNEIYAVLSRTPSERAAHRRSELDQADAG